MISNIYGDSEIPKPVLERQSPELRKFLETRVSEKLITNATTLMEIMNSLPDDEFAQAYLLSMQSYDFWSNNQKPSCFSCHDPILRPEDLRRYHGTSMHPDCFRAVYSQERDKLKDVTSKEYFNRVYRL